MLWTAMLLVACSEEEPLQGPLSVHVHRSERRLYLIDGAGQVLVDEPIGIGRGGLGEKEAMHDLITPTGSFTVDLVLSEAGTHNAVAPGVVERFAGDPEFAGLLAGDPGLKGLFANMNRIDFDGDGAPDRAYGSAYIGLTSDEAVTGPKMRRYQGTAYWYSIALHGTPVPENLGAANSGGCVHLSPALLNRLITEEILTLGSVVTIADVGPGSPPGLGRAIDADGP